MPKGRTGQRPIATIAAKCDQTRTLDKMKPSAPSSASGLPINAVLGALVEALKTTGTAVVVAPPGSGKTTVVPPALLDAGLLGDGRLVMLQPRRVAARSTAHWMARQRGASIGQEIGYSVRFDRKMSRHARIEVVTEGILTRRLQVDPFLEGVSCVVLDEFHERSVHADLALAMLAEVRREVRPDLKIVVMSATLDAQPVAHFLGGAPIVQCDGRLHEVTVDYVAPAANERLATSMSEQIRRCVARMKRGEQPDGHLLAFFAGVADIERVRKLLAGKMSRDIVPLHGRLNHTQQDRAITGEGPPRVILATNIAETSLTIDGVTCVVDSGREKVSIVDSIIGLSRLVQRRISRASADQRAGRAGRTHHGHCVRLWNQLEHNALAAFSGPEIARIDLCWTLLQVRAWGKDADTFEWFERPPVAEVTRAQDVLRAVGAVDADGLTELGRRLAHLPVHPRVGRALLDGERHGARFLAASMAALIEEGDILKQAPLVVGDDDLELRLDAIARAEAERGAGRWSRHGLHPHRAARFVQVRDALLQLLPGRADRRPSTTSQQVSSSQLLLGGFGDRVARQRKSGGDGFVLVGGHGAKLSRRSCAQNAELIFAVSIRAGQRGEHAQHLIDIACPVQRTELPVETRRTLRFDAKSESVVASEQSCYRDLVLDSRPIAANDAQASTMLAAAARQDPTRALQLNKEAASLLARARFVAHYMPELQIPSFAELDQVDATPDAVGSIIEAACIGKRSFAALRKVDLAALMRGLLGNHKRTLDRYAPITVKLPTGRSVRLRYDGESAVLAARIQHLFGLHATPQVVDGRANVIVHLLAPNGRPAQITSDLGSFWRSSYTDVRKSLRGRYPKHAWPEVPP